MKRNIFLRLALCLLAAAVIGTSVFTVSLAKYVAAAAGEATARVAKFSFVTNPTPGSAPETGKKQIAVDAGKVEVFNVPLFDTAYYKPHAWVDGPYPGDTTKTVISSLSDAVVAPGVGLGFGPNATTANDLVDLGEGAGYYGYRTVTFKNDSEVAVRYKFTVEDSPSLQSLPICVLARQTEIWSLLAGATLTGDTGVPGWRMLEPGGEDNLHFGFIWFFDGVNYPSATLSWLAGMGVTFDDERDSLLGLAAANYLRAVKAGNTTAAATYLAATQMNVAFKLEVEQVD